MNKEHELHLLSLKAQHDFLLQIEANMAATFELHLLVLFLQGGGGGVAHLLHEHIRNRQKALDDTFNLYMALAATYHIDTTAIQQKRASYVMAW